MNYRRPYTSVDEQGHCLRKLYLTTLFLVISFLPCNLTKLPSCTKTCSHLFITNNPCSTNARHNGF